MSKLNGKVPATVQPEAWSLHTDHKIRTKYKGWQEAQKLKRYDKLFHLRKSFIKRANKNFRVRLYGTNSYMELEEQLIKREYFRATS